MVPRGVKRCQSTRPHVRPPIHLKKTRVRRARRGPYFAQLRAPQPGYAKGLLALSPSTQCRWLQRLLSVWVAAGTQDNFACCNPQVQSALTTFAITARGTIMDNILADGWEDRVRLKLTLAGP